MVEHYHIGRLVAEGGTTVSPCYEEKCTQPRYDHCVRCQEWRLVTQMHRREADSRWKEFDSFCKELELCARVATLMKRKEVVRVLMQETEGAYREARIALQKGGEA